MGSRHPQPGQEGVVSAEAVASGGFNKVVMQGFEWSTLSNRGSQFKTVGDAASELASAGFTAVWFSPPSVSVDKQGYMPQHWTTLEGESNQKAAVKAVGNAGLVPVADVVVNHRCAPAKDDCTNEYTAFAAPPMDASAVVTNDDKCNNAGVFCPGNCACAHADTGDNFCGAPDLDHTNGAVQADVKKYLQFLKDVGYRGWRFDMVKGYSPSYVGDYVRASSAEFAVGEFFDGDAGKVAGWVSGTGGRAAAFDFPLRFKLKSAIGSDDYSGLNGMLGGSGSVLVGRSPGNAVPFVDNHDTARDDRFGGADALTMGYAFVLTHPGSPCVFWGDWAQGSVQSAIKTLLQIRQSAGITSTSSWDVVHTGNGLYAAYVGGKVAMKLGTHDWSPDDSSYKLKTSGNNYAVWAK